MLNKMAGFLVLIVSQVALANPNELMGEALKYKAKIHENTPIERRLELYGNIFEVLDKIVAQHPGSDQAINILSNQSIGDFNQEALRSDYIKELTSYYDTVCEANPSYSCLGFVSLSAGQQACSAANSAKDLVEAHQNLKNAAQIFIGQDEDPAYVLLALDEYRSCLDKSKFKATTYGKDLFAADLVELLLASEKRGMAKAVIENMKTPAFKVQGVLSISKYEEKPFDNKFFERLKKYIEEKVDDREGNQKLSALDLVMENFRRGKEVISYIDVRWGFRTGREWGQYTKYCDAFMTRTAIERVFELQENIVNLKLSRRGYTKGQAPSLMEQISNEWDEILNACYSPSDESREYALSAELHGQLILLSKESASEFRVGVLNSNWDSSKQIEFVVKALGKYQKLFEAQYGLREDAKGNRLIRLGPILKSDRALLPVFEQLVDYGNICEAAKILFQRIKGKSAYDDAIEYMITSDAIKMNAKHDCGDAELELLKCKA
ncbi:hypothetical protein [Spartinivicinus ruber]|uniref:hypothetical protein n=1 Tax=Spartinivicinus ruber TaxID=2683272 RepID=UPI0013D0F075|nr:hypothetical protein [Spartinivicinus ruber]